MGTPTMRTEYRRFMPAIPEAARAGRDLVCHAFRDWAMTDRIDDGMTVISEMTANAIKVAAGQTIEIRVLLTEDRRPLLEVWDPSPLEPEFVEPDELSENGRGLLIIDVLSGGRCGHRKAAHGLGKVVWARLP
jgi:anti-sigma regulatory factor (Ser/Thr protein kinase)